jgi:hypothetical protein
MSPKLSIDMIVTPGSLTSSMNCATQHATATLAARTANAAHAPDALLRRFGLDEC